MCGCTLLALLAATTAAAAALPARAAPGEAAQAGRPPAEPARLRLRKRSRPGSLLLTASANKDSLTQARAHTVPASWFGDFAAGESTYDPDAIDKPAGGSVPSIQTAPGVKMRNVVPPEWFQESPSGGPKAAWQTFFPELRDSKPYGEPTPEWRRGVPEADAMQGYVPEGAAYRHAKSAMNKGADWFDAGVGQFDSFGRPRAPSEASDRFYAEWEERSRSVALQCGPPGCVANASLKVLDSATERLHRCLLSVSVHPTDFDHISGREQLEWILVNGRMVSKGCAPLVLGCRNESASQLYPCVTDLDIDQLIDAGAGGTVEIAGKLSPLVDECAIDGNLLSGVVTVRCLVRQALPAPLPAPRPRPAPAPDDAAVQPDYGNATLRCSEPGCVANASVQLLPGAVNRTCRLTISLRQTDFDGDQGSAEEIEWVKVNGQVVKEHAVPGRNPCKEALKNGSLNATEAALDAEPFELLRDVEVVPVADTLQVSAKLSEMVDECPGPGGYLLDAVATVDC